MVWRVTKTYGHDLGLSACFRQWRADSHCRFLHGYPLSFEFVFESDTLNLNNWVTDFGGMKALKQALVDSFDHKLVIASDDPRLDELAGLAGLGLADVLVLPAVGCEQFAKYAWDLAHDHVEDLRLPRNPTFYERMAVARVRLIEVECREHGANSASYLGEAR